MTVLLLPAHPGFAKQSHKSSKNNCETILIHADIENRYNRIRKDKDSQNQEIKVQNSGNIYKQLTSELNQLNQELYKLETTDVERFIF